MRLDQALVARKLCQTRTEAQELIAKGAVLVNLMVVTKQNKTVLEGDILTLTDSRKFVSRGGEKLEGALLHTRINVENMTVLDVGSSTGGFTDCLLKQGVERVVAVDVGTDQLHISLRSDARLSLHEKTDIREFETSEQFDCIVGDVSFIPLSYIVPSLKRLSVQGTKILFLVKPQFEVGKGSTKKGIVRDEFLYEGVIQSVTQVFTENNFLVKEVFPSSIVGGDGNREFFIYAIKE